MTIMTDSDVNTGMLSCLRHRNFALFWSGQAFSSVGNQMFPIILATTVLRRGSGADGLGLTLAAQGVAIAIGTLFAASAGDRWPRSKIMIFADIVRMLGVAIIAAKPAILPSVALIAVISAIGIAEGIFNPAYNAVAPRLLPKSALQAGNALNALALYTATVIGPVLAGVLIATVGIGPALWVDVSTFAASLLTLLLLNEVSDRDEESTSGNTTARSAFRDFAVGLRAVRNRPWVGMSIVTATLVMTFVVAPAFISAPIVADRRLGGASAYGWMFTAYGAGSIIGSVWGGRIKTRRRGVVAVVGIATIFCCVGSLALLPLPGILAGWVISGVGVTIFEITWTTALQTDVPDRLLGRVMALDWLGSQGLMPLGYAAAGVLISTFGTRGVLIGGAILVLLLAPLPLLVRGGTTFSTLVSGETVDFPS